MPNASLCRRAVAAFAEPLLEDRLPDFTPAERAEMVGFVVDRWQRMAQFPAGGIGAVALALFPVVKLAGRGSGRRSGWVLRQLLAGRAPLVREFADFVLALAVAYAYERWPPERTEVWSSRP